MTDRTVRMGIIGLGAQGGYYAGFLSRGRVPNVQLAAICDTDEALFAPERLAWFNVASSLARNDS